MSDKGLGDRFCVSRRQLLCGAAAGAAGVAGALLAPGLVYAAPRHLSDATIDLSRQVPFYGAGPQAGIRTPPQHYAAYMTLDLATTDRSKLQMLLALWSAAIAQVVQGKPIGKVEPGRPHAVGRDTGEALGLGPASLTVTVGLGPGIFSDKLGLASHKPALLRELKPMPGDSLKPEISGGDLSLQACADDPQVAYHAIRNLARLASQTGAATTRWAILGFGRASAGKGQTTPRNLFGFRDGTRNVNTDDEYNKFVWVKDGPAWQRHGTYQVLRKIEMRIETWDVDQVSDQDRIFGRHKVSGAPLTGTKEFDTPDFTARNSAGELVINPRAHIALAAHEHNHGIKILRRPYNFTQGLNAFALLDAGLLFLTYQNDPAHFELLQTKLGSSDLLNEYITHVSSGVFFIPPAPRPGSYIGEAMFT